MTDDGQLVLFEDGNLVWTADKQQPFSHVLKRPGEKGPPFFYISNSGFLHHPAGKYMWVAEASHSKDKSNWTNTHMALQVDGNLVIQDMRRVWPKTNYPFQPSQLAPIPLPQEEPLQVGHHYSTGDHYLVLQADGNMGIFTSANQLTWQSGTAVPGGSRAMVQADGNFVIHDSNNKVLWQTGTGRFPQPWPCIQPDGQLMIMNVVPVWARFGFTPGRNHHRKIYQTRWDKFPLVGEGFPIPIVKW